MQGILCGPLSTKNQVKGSDPCGPSRRGIRVRVAEENSVSDIGAKLCGDVKNHPRFWFSAGTCCYGEMWANANGINTCIDRIQCGIELGVYSIEVGGCHEPFTDALLVCDHRDLPASIFERFDGIHYTGENNKLIWRTNILSREVLVDNTIPVKKRDANRGCHQLADGR